MRYKFSIKGFVAALVVAAIMGGIATSFAGTGAGPTIRLALMARAPWVTEARGRVGRGGLAGAFTRVAAVAKGPRR